MPEHERILAGDIQPGDRVARTRTAIFREVRTVALARSAVTVRIDYVGGNGRDRPRQTAKWWRLVPDA